MITKCKLTCCRVAKIFHVSQSDTNKRVRSPKSQASGLKVMMVMVYDELKPDTCVLMLIVYVYIYMYIIIYSIRLVKRYHPNKDNY